LPGFKTNNLLLISRVIKPNRMHNCSRPKDAAKKGAIMKIKAGAIFGILVLSGPLSLFAATATGPHEPATSRGNTATTIEKPKVVISSLKVSTLQEGSHTEKRSRSSAGPQETLCGLKGVMVFIEDIASDIEKNGLTKNLIQKEVESRLRRADIPVLTREEAYDTPGKPYLYLSLTTHNTGIDLYSYSVTIEFNQDVSLIREPSIRTSATTWIANVVGIVGARNFPAVTEDVTELADKFIRDYVAANHQ
jgi:hypothetical protein